MKKNKNVLRNILYCCGMGLLLMVVGCQKAKDKDGVKAFDMVAAQQSIDSCNTAFTEAFNKGDASGVANCYTADAKFMSPNAPAVEGMPAIQKEVEGYFKNGVATIQIKSVGLWGDENVLVEENSWSISDKDGKHLDHGKSLVAYKKDKGSWKMFRDCYNSDMPMAPTAPEPVQ